LQNRLAGGSLVLMWRAFRLAVLLAAVVAVWACECPPPGDEIFLLRMPVDAATQKLIDRCRDPALPDCLPLCQALEGMRAQIIHCELHPETDPNFIQVHVGTAAFCPGG
jgi:hypothetical protein